MMARFTLVVLLLLSWAWLPCTACRAEESDVARQKTRELERGRRYLAGLIEISMQRGSTRAASYAVAEVAGVGYERIGHLPEIIRSVTPDDVIRAARLYVSAEDAPAVAVLRG